MFEMLQERLMPVLSVANARRMGRAGLHQPCLIILTGLVIQLALGMILNLYIAIPAAGGGRARRPARRVRRRRGVRQERREQRVTVHGDPDWCGPTVLHLSPGDHHQATAGGIAGPEVNGPALSPSRAFSDALNIPVCA